MDDLDPLVAPWIAEPDDILVDRLKNGALLLKAVPSGIFNTHNPVHLAAALRIQTALEPLNAAKETYEGQ
jgi:hypothetical protein